MAWPLSPLRTRDGVHRVYFTLSEAVGEITDAATFPRTGIINAEIRLADCAGDNLLEEIFHRAKCVCRDKSVCCQNQRNTHTNGVLIMMVVCTSEIGGPNDRPPELIRSDKHVSLLATVQRCA